MPEIYYTRGYRYQLERGTEQFVRRWGLAAPGLLVVGNRFVRLTPDGRLLISAGYAWDGSSGPAIDTRASQRASLVHDALYQLIGEGHLPPSERISADRAYRDICREDGSPWLLSRWRYMAVRLFGPRGGSRPREVLTSPSPRIDDA